MRNRILDISMVLGLLVLSFFSSCSGNKDKGDSVKLEFETYGFDCIAEDMNFNSNDLISPEDTLMKYTSYTGNGILPKAIGKSDIKALRDSLIAMAGVEFTSGASAVPQLDTCCSVINRKVNLEDGCSTSVSNLTVTLATPKIIVWECYRYMYPYMAAHGTYSTSYLNYSIPENRIISLDDIFKPGYRPELSRVINEKIREMDIYLFDPDSNVEIPSDFEITNNGISFIWGLYSIAPYAAGEIRVEIEGYEVSDILSKFGSNLFL